ncbi:MULTISPECIES: hypothetical protein [Nocardia]|uniref:hypothetical protein n=1 Tax=Nocardia TaxID=1817 RepID=UPI0012F4C13A|nr:MULTISPECIES: hypothetical protein [Nocardia]MCC3311416.1 hypothetical protein [Nocardia africana]
MPEPGMDEDMPKNTSSRRRRRARRIAAQDNVKYSEALRRGDELAAQVREQVRRNARLRPTKVTIGGIEKYWRRDDAEQLGPTGMEDPSRVDIVAAADALMPKVVALQSARLNPTTVVVPYWQRDTVSQNDVYEDFRTTLHQVLNDLKRVREDAELHCVDWRTVAAAYYGVDAKLKELDRITGGPLHDRLESAMQSAGVLSMTAEAVHSRGCLLSADRSRRLSWGYSPCSGGDIRVRVRIFDDETTVTVPGCARHAAEEIVCFDYEVEDGYISVEIMGGTDDDLDVIYDLAEEVRREREERQREYAKDKFAVRTVPEPPWHRGQDYW